MKQPQNQLIILWLLLFMGVSFYHSYQFHLYLDRLPSFYSTWKNVAIIGLILSALSLVASFPLLIWFRYWLPKQSISKKGLIRLNSIISAYSALVFFIFAYLTASWSQALEYVGSYFLAILLIAHAFYLRWRSKWN